MTKYDLRIAAIILAGVVALGLALGFGIGWLTRPDGGRVANVPTVPPAFDAAAGSGAKLPDGARVPGYQEVYVNDYADLLDKSAEDRVRANLIELYDNSGVEMTVLTIEWMNGFDHQGTIESFATRLFNTWGIGNASRNDGVLILVSRFDREMRIELGSGFASSYDAVMKRVIDRTFIPAFKTDDYQGGIEAGVEETIYQIVGVYPGTYDSGTFERGWQRIWRWLQGFGGFLYALVAVPVGAVALWIRRYLRNRPRRCGQCSTLMVRAGEQADDEHLDGGQRLEEFLQSVDYDVWHCPSCGQMRIERYKAWLARHGSCPQCSYRTLKTTSTVLKSATTTSTGSKQVDYNCQHCDYESREIRTIPKVSKSSSGSGSSRSSFGGGSSSGGGASGSW